MPTRVCMCACVYSCTQDTEATVCDLQVPQVDPEVVGGDVGLEVGVDGDGVDVVGVCVAEDTPRRRLHHQVHGLQHGHLERERQRERETERERERFMLHTYI